MKTEDCELATSEHVALNRGTTELLHRNCPGAFQDPKGEVHRCDCECHGSTPTPSMHLVNLPVRTMPVSRPEPAPAHQDRPAPRTAGGRVCECECGEPVSPTARFRPGHDAKLKSRLLGEARRQCRCLMSGDAHLETCSADRARKQLRELGWDHFI